MMIYIDVAPVEKNTLNSRKLLNSVETGWNQFIAWGWAHHLGYR